MNIIEHLTTFIIEYIQPYISNKSDDDLQIAKYGLTLLFMDLYKLPIIFSLSIFLGIFKYCFLCYILFSIIRSQSHGLHMQSGKGCLFYTTIAFFLTIYISKLLSINFIFKLVFNLLILYSIYKHAPADTENNPILNSNTRMNKKKNAIFISIMYIFFSITIKNHIISNMFFLILILNSILINPFTYKLFNRRYNNYEYY